MQGKIAGQAAMPIRASAPGADQEESAAARAGGTRGMGAMETWAYQEKDMSAWLTVRGDLRR